MVPLLISCLSTCFYSFHFPCRIFPLLNGLFIIYFTVIFQVKDLIHYSSFSRYHFETVIHFSYFILKNSYNKCSDFFPVVEETLKQFSDANIFFLNNTIITYCPIAKGKCWGLYCRNLFACCRYLKLTSNINWSQNTNDDT